MSDFTKAMFTWVVGAQTGLAVATVATGKPLVAALICAAVLNAVMVFVWVRK